MNHLLMLSLLAVMPMIEGQVIEKLEACTTKTNDLQVSCMYTIQGDVTTNYEWKFMKKPNEVLLVASSISPNLVAPVYKNRATVHKTNTLVQLTLTGFGTADDGSYECHLIFPKQEANKTVLVEKAKVVTCGAPGLLLSAPWMLSLLLSLTVLQALDALPGRSEN
uniref:thy-1 membrane glycoprotein-like n=1 Tax=Pristiophorus japonicus TaxID=55135 RepID=UPI00398E9B1E